MCKDTVIYTVYRARMYIDIYTYIRNYIYTHTHAHWVNLYCTHQVAIAHPQNPMCTNFCPQETAIPFPWHHKIESKTKGSGQCLRLGRRHYNFYPSSELLTILILPPKIECIPMKQCTAISDLFILGSLLGYFTHTNFLGCFKGKLTGTPCFFPLYPVPEQFFPSMKHTCSWRCLSTSRTTHTHTIIGIPKNPNSGKKQNPSGSLRYTFPTTYSHIFFWWTHPSEHGIRGSQGRFPRTGRREFAAEPRPLTSPPFVWFVPQGPPAADQAGPRFGKQEALVNRSRFHMKPDLWPILGVNTFFPPTLGGESSETWISSRICGYTRQ